MGEYGPTPSPYTLKCVEERVVLTPAPKSFFDAMVRARERALMVAALG